MDYLHVPYSGPQPNASGLMKYGAVKVASHAPAKPIAAAIPNVYDRSRCDGISPPASQAYVATIPL